MVVTCTKVVYNMSMKHSQDPNIQSSGKVQKLKTDHESYGHSNQTV